MRGFLFVLLSLSAVFQFLFKGLGSAFGAGKPLSDRAAAALADEKEREAMPVRETGQG